MVINEKAAMILIHVLHVDIAAITMALKSWVDLHDRFSLDSNISMTTVNLIFIRDTQHSSHLLIF